MEVWSLKVQSYGSLMLCKLFIKCPMTIHLWLSEWLNYSDLCALEYSHRWVKTQWNEKHQKSVIEKIIETQICDVHCNCSTFLKSIKSNLRVKKQIDSCFFTPKRYRTMKRKVKISSITGTGRRHSWWWVNWKLPSSGLPTGRQSWGRHFWN